MSSEKKTHLSSLHTLAECWNPHLHAEPYKFGQAETFYFWHQKHYEDNPHSNIKRVATLCEFGGVQFSPYIANEQADGTYLVCPKCNYVDMCGWQDNNPKPQPEKCPKCKAVLGLNDYFQAVSKAGSFGHETVIDPMRDPALTLAEVCELAPSGLPLLKLGAIIVILKDERRLHTGSFIGELAISERSVGLDAVKEIVWREHWVAIDSLTNGFNVKATMEGRAVLCARQVQPLPGASERVAELLALGEKELQATAWRVLANRVLAK